ncbi:MAG TPA: MFS transporter [Polyangiaceae bacterium]|nr:MFS transporter [Polyangiaceae bacterium]
MEASGAPPPPAGKQGDHVAAVLASFLGWTLDAFDFFLVVMCLTAVGKEFAVTDKAVAATLTVTLAFRPLGALLFGLLADRYGRRLPLMLDLLFYSVVEVASGFAPNFTTFLVLRALFGIGMGGEWGVGASLAMEKVPPRLRGVFSGFLQQGYAVGYLLAALAYYFVFPRFGWRALFYLGGLPALLALFVRSHVKESEVWEKTKRTSWPELIRAVLQNKKLFLELALFMTAMGFASHGTQDMYPTFLQRHWGFDVKTRTVITALSMLGALAGGIAVGLWSDRIGRRRAIQLSLLGGILVVPLWAFAPNVPLLVVGAFLIQFFVQGAWGVIPAHITEVSPDAVRGFLPGFAYQCGILVAGSVTVLEATLSERMPYSWAMAMTAVTVFAAGAALASTGRERKGIAYGEDTAS